MGIAQGSWDCLKMYLGGLEAHLRQRRLSRTIVGIEAISQGVVYNLAAFSYYLGVRRHAPPRQVSRSVLAAVSIGAGVVVSAAGRAGIWRRRGGTGGRR